ncbi:hypothetical protein [Streptococcus agalactiae]|uniref:hypothetical protein n=1 Tax=Streptococcus agalactiae TaxID=1311 RepID=UPI0022EA5F91|nr:hypothetical protein [Streptococcus agalactiae]
MEYTVELNGKTLTYGPLVENSRFSEEEWSAIYAEVVNQNQPDIYELKKDDKDYLDVFGALISLEERYEELLENLPQDEYSKAGTHPMWVAEAVEENTLNKEDTQLDVKDMIDNCEDIDELKESLTEYFELEG